MLSRLKSTCRSCFDLLAEVTEVAPTDCVVEISKSTGELGAYQEVLYCRILLLDLSFLAFVFTEHWTCKLQSVKNSSAQDCQACWHLTEETCKHPVRPMSKDDSIIGTEPNSKAMYAGATLKTETIAPIWFHTHKAITIMKLWASAWYCPAKCKHCRTCAKPSSQVAWCWDLKHWREFFCFFLNMRCNREKEYMHFQVKFDPN